MKLLKQLFCKQHTFKKYEVLSDNLTFLGWNYSTCVHCEKRWLKLSKEKQQQSKYIDSGIANEREETNERK